MKKVLLLGGNGYIGSRFYVDHKSKYNIDSIDLCLFGKDLSYSLPFNYNTVDISDYDCIICLAGHSSVQMCEYSPERSWVNNVDYFKSLCERLTHDQTLIYASSASVYGNIDYVADEETPINFNTINHYDLQKTVIDLIANRFINVGKSIIGLRFGTVNGLSPNIRSDLMLNSMVKSALETKTINAKNLHIKRAILGVNDLSNALSHLLDNHISSGQYNLCSFNSTVGELATAVANITNSELIINPDDAKAYDFALNTDKFIRHTEFKFKDTVESLINQLYNGYSQVTPDIRDTDRDFNERLH